MFISERLLYFANNKYVVALCLRVGRQCVSSMKNVIFSDKNDVRFFAIAVICEKSFNFVKKLFYEK